ncbi:MAG: maltokinase N-terminal cap-like domain-containing protein [Acidimicrobiales bacterium]
MPALPDGLEAMLAAYLGAQRWYSGDGTPPQGVSVESARELWTGAGGDHRLWHAVVAVDQGAGSRYQLVVGERPAGEPADFLHGHEEAVVGSLGSAYFYDATLDSEMARVLLAVASAGAESAARARPVAAEQSNTSVVFDDRLILKVFRRLHEGRNPDVEVTTALAADGFEHVAKPLVTWRESGFDLAFGQEYLAGGAEGWALALTSLRDLYDSRDSLPADAGGDFAAEASRLGRVTAEMHVAMEASFGAASRGAASQSWRGLVEGLRPRLERAGDVAGRDLAGLAAPLLAHLGSLRDAGPAFRVHGDYHLGQVMRTDAGWYVLDFEGEPAKPLAERTAPSSPLKDITSMLRSFQYASRHALTAQPTADLPHLEELAGAWEGHNRGAFLEGYRSVEAVERLLPGPAAIPAVLAAYELDKALYELDYELRYRPEWVGIPLDALSTLIDGDPDGRT